MNLIAVDDERLALDNLIAKLRIARPNANIKGFLEPHRALKETQGGFRPDIAFLDIEMYGMNGIELAVLFKKAFPKINLIFVTGFSQYAPDAFALHASGYITKPVDVEQIQEELENLRHPLPRSSLRIKVQTFGSFEVFVDGVPLKFQRSRTKELLAYLVDRRGAGSTIAELAAVLWEDRKYSRSIQNQLQVHISDLIKTLREANAEQILYKKRNFISVDVNSFDCDYYAFLKGDISAINSFAGEYMSNYSWSELTAGLLFSQKDNADSDEPGQNILSDSKRMKLLWESLRATDFF